MPKPRGRAHSSLTETATIVVLELKKIAGIKMIAPGEIRPNRSRGGTRFVTAVYTKAGFELLISGQSSQKIAVHTTTDPRSIFAKLTANKRFHGWVFKERERRPGI
jgi:hypothetical protein